MRWPASRTAAAASSKGCISAPCRATKASISCATQAVRSAILCIQTTEQSCAKTAQFDTLEAAVKALLFLVSKKCLPLMQHYKHECVSSHPLLVA